MHRLKKVQGRQTITLSLALMTVFFVVFIILFPNEAFQASLQGLTIWWKFVFPAMLPFLVTSEMLVELGVVHGIGVLFEPLMRFLFRVPGVGSWAIAMGFTAGLPAGAEVVSKLRKQTSISASEGERLLAISHLLSPIFIVLVIGVGFLQDEELGLVIAVSYYVSAFFTAIFMRFHAASTPLLASNDLNLSSKKKTSIFTRSIIAMQTAQKQNKRSFGQLLGESVNNSIQTLMIIGGYIMMFSVLINVMHISHLIQPIIMLLNPLFSWMGLRPNTTQQFITGLFEMNLGSYALSQSANTILLWKAALITSILGWSGISSLLQVKTLIRGTDLSFPFFLWARFFHAIVAVPTTMVLWNPLHQLLRKMHSYISPAMSSQRVREHHNLLLHWNGWTHLPQRFSYLLWFFLILIVLNFLAYWIKQLHSR